MSALTVKGLSGGYGRVPVLWDIDLHVGAGEIVGLLGANGAGKSTLLRALSGTLPVSDGEVWLADVALHRIRPSARVRHGLAHVPEGRHVFSAMTVRENLEVAGIAGRQAVRCEDIFDLFPRLQERERQTAGSLSGGEQQMLAIGRALMTDPRVLVIDEMSAGLAPAIVEVLVDALAGLRSRSTGLLLVEQSPHFVAEAVDRVYLLERGRVVGEGSLEALGGADRLAELYLGV